MIEPDVMKARVVKIVLCRVILSLGVIAIMPRVGYPKSIYTPAVLKKPNVILITIDSLRADHLGCYGYKYPTTPNIDRLAREGAIFRQAISQGSFTAPSMASIMTSVYPNKHGVRHWGDAIDRRFIQINQILKKHGFFTGVISGFDFFASIPGFGDGFDTFNAEMNLSAEEFTKRVIGWLEEHQHKEFFLWVHYFDVHEPYRPPDEFERMFVRSEDIKAKKVPIFDVVEVPEQIEIYGGINGIPSYAVIDGRTDVDFFVELYDAEIRSVDQQVGVLLDRLNSMHLDENTLIILTADHGEALGEHNLYFSHGTFLYDELLRVPLIIKYKNLIPDHEEFDSQVRLIDIVPTILEILKLKPYRQMQGKSLLPLILRGGSFSQPIAFSEIETVASARTSEWKLIFNSDLNGGWYELYDLKDDPNELINLYESQKGRVKSLRKALDYFLKHGAKTTTNPDRVLDKDTIDNLKGLGYLQ